MTTERDVYDIDTSGAVEGLEHVADAADHTTHAQKTLGDQLVDLNAKFSHHVMALQTYVEIAKEAAEFVKEGIKEWQAQAEAIARQTVLLKNHGEEATHYSERLEEQRKQLERNQGVEEAYTANLQNVILTMGVAADEVVRFTEDSIMLAKAMNQDAVTAARLLARAHADGKEELKKYGITVKDTAELGGHFGAVLAEVEARTKGINEAMPEYTQLVNNQAAAWAEVKKGIGGAAAELWVFLNRNTEADPKVQAFFAKIHQATLDARNLELKSILEAHGLGEKEQPTIDLEPINVEIQTPEYKARVRADRAERVKEMSAFMKQLHDAQQQALKEVEAEDASDRQDSLDKLQNFYQRAAKEAKDYNEANAAIQKMVNKQAVDDAEEAAKKEVEAQKQAAERVKAIKQDMLSEFKAYAQQILASVAGIVGDTLTSNTQFNQKMKEFQIDREMATAKELGQNKTRVQIEKQLQQEEQASNAARIADTLKGIAEQAAVKAIFEGVAAIASAADYDEGAAYQHLAAAAGFAAVALAAGGTTAAISASRGLTTQERTQLEDAQKTKAETAAREDKQAGQVAVGAAQIVNVYNLGITGKTTAEQGKELEAIYKEFDLLKTGS